jgi:hypothetical protein
MLRTRPDTEPAPDVTAPPDPIPLSHLELDLPAPTTGWGVELDRRGVAIVLDDLGRPSISRDAARELLAEQRAQQEAAARKREEAEQRAIEADQRYRAQLAGGIPADAVPVGMTAAALMMASDPEHSQRPRRRSVLEESLDNSGTLTYHPIRGES